MAHVVGSVALALCGVAWTVAPAGAADTSTPSPGAENKAGAPANLMRVQPQAPVIERSAADYLAECMRDWDAATNMSRQEWARTCKRVVDARVKFFREQEKAKGQLPTSLGLQ